MNKFHSGVEGLDDLFQEGFPNKSNVLIYGKAGSGKTLISLEIIYKGASQFNEPGVFVSFDQTEEELIAQCCQFDWDIRKYIKLGKIKILTCKIVDVNRDFVNLIIDAVTKIKAKRLVIDNLALLTLSLFFNTEGKKFTLIENNKVKVASNSKQLIYNLITALKYLPTTTFYITASGEEDDSSVDGISEYICDGVISMGCRSLGKSFLRTIEIKKMRRTNIVGGIQSFKMTKNGLKVEI